MLKKKIVKNIIYIKFKIKTFNTHNTKNYSINDCTYHKANHQHNNNIIVLKILNGHWTTSKIIC